MNKILLIAQRDFLTTISNKGFLFGLFIMPLLIAVAVLLGPRILNASRSPQVVGRVAVMDPTGRVLPELRRTLSTPAIETRRKENARRQLGEYFARLAFRPADEQHVTGAERSLRLTHQNGLAVHLLAGNDVVESLSKWIFAGDADVESGFGALAGGPLNELRKVQQEGCLHFILGRLLHLSR